MTPNTTKACYDPNNITFPGDGTVHLNITSVPSTCGGVTMPYTGALISTNPDDGRSSGGFQYTYGVLEARVYIPAIGNEIADWPAVWTDGQDWPADGENDIMEAFGGSVHSIFHGAVGDKTTVTDAEVTPGWHVFASDWEPGSVTDYYDGVAVATFTTGITSSPMFIVIDNSVPAGWPQDAAADSMQVQYVKVWQQ